MLQTKQQAVLDGFRHVFFTELTETPSFRRQSRCMSGHPVAGKQKRFTCFSV